MRHLVLVMLFFVLALGVLVACEEEEEPPAPTNEPNQPAVAEPPTVVPTRVVTREPANAGIAVSPTPAVNPAWRAFIVSDWTLLLRYEVEGSTLGQDVSYTASMPLMIDESGRVSSQETFSVSIGNRRCLVLPESTRALEFALQGQLRLADEDQVFADLTLSPRNPTAPERYEQTCTALTSGEQVTEIIETNVLWPVLRAAEQTDFTLDLRQTGSRLDDIQADVSATLGSEGAVLRGEIVLTR